MELRSQIGSFQEKERSWVRFASSEEALKGTEFFLKSLKCERDFTPGRFCIMGIERGGANGQGIWVTSGN